MFTAVGVFLLLRPVQTTCRSAAANGPILHIPDGTWVNRDGGMILTGENRRTGRETWPSAIAHPTWTSVRANVARVQQFSVNCMERREKLVKCVSLQSIVRHWLALKVNLVGRSEFLPSLYFQEKRPFLLTQIIKQRFIRSYILIQRTVCM
jgi:hypothetical protein